MTANSLAPRTRGRKPASNTVTMPISAPTQDELMGNSWVAEVIGTSGTGAELPIEDSSVLSGLMPAEPTAGGGAPVSDAPGSAGQEIPGGIEGFDQDFRLGDWASDPVEHALANAGVEGNQQTGPDSSWTGEDSFANGASKGLSAAASLALLVDKVAAAEVAAGSAGIGAGLTMGALLGAAGAGVTIGLALNEMGEATGALPWLHETAADTLNGVDSDEETAEAGAAARAEGQARKAAREAEEAGEASDASEEEGIEFTDEEAEDAAEAAEDQLEGGMSPEEWLDFMADLDGQYMANQLAAGQGSGTTQPDDLGGALDGELPPELLAMIDDECNNLVIMGVNSEQEAYREVDSGIGTLIQ